MTRHVTLSEIKPLFEKLVEAFSNIILRMQVNFFIIIIIIIVVIILILILILIIIIIIIIIMFISHIAQSNIR